MEHGFGKKRLLENFAMLISWEQNQFQKRSRDVDLDADE
jgi:hypothetical protein